MNGDVHENIGREGFRTLPDEIQKKWIGREESIIKSCNYPDTDIFSDRNMSEAQRRRVDLEAHLFLEPYPPKAGWYKKLNKKMSTGFSSFALFCCTMMIFC